MRRVQKAHEEQYKNWPEDELDCMPELHLLDSNLDIAFSVCCMVITMFLEYFYIERSEDPDGFFKTKFIAGNNILSTAILVKDVFVSINLVSVLRDEIKKIQDNDGSRLQEGWKSQNLKTQKFEKPTNLATIQNHTILRVIR